MSMAQRSVQGAITGDASTSAPLLRGGSRSVRRRAFRRCGRKGVRQSRRAASTGSTRGAARTGAALARRLLPDNLVSDALSTPKGVASISPGRSPGNACRLERAALKGRNSPMNVDPSGLPPTHANDNPGRCPGLLNLPPSGSFFCAAQLSGTAPSPGGRADPFRVRANWTVPSPAGTGTG